MMAIKHVLVPTDFSDPSERALALAIQLARSFDARLTLMHVWTIPNTSYAEALTWPVDEMENAARKALDELQARTSKQYPIADAVLRVGSDWEQIISVAKERDVDLIVMGTHGRRGLPRLVLGSVAEKVVRLSPVPVLTVGSPDDANAKKKAES